jgi:hypothetical protein
MKSFLRFFVTAAALSAALVVPSLNAEESALVDFGKFASAPDREFVEINLRAGLLKFAAKIVAIEEPEAAELIRNIRHVRVNVVGLDDSNRRSTIERVEAIRADLEKRGWEKIVTVREGQDQGGDDIAIYMKTRGDEAIDGIVVTVVEKRGEAVLVNIVGDIRAEQIAKLGEKLDVAPLRKLKLRELNKAGEPKETT